MKTWCVGVSLQLLLPECCFGTPLIRNTIILLRLMANWSVLRRVTQLANLVVQFLVLSELFWGGLFQISLGLLTELWECTDLLGQFILHEECRNGVEDRGLLNDTVVREEIPGLSEYEQTEADYKSFVNRNISGHLSCVFEVSITEFLSSIGRI